MLDTEKASCIVRGPGPTLAARLVAAPMSKLCVSSITQGESLHGLARKPGATNLQTAVREFLARIDVLAWDSEAATRYGVLRAELERGGTPLGNLDTLIAAHARAEAAILVTNDQAFARVPACRKLGIAMTGEGHYSRYSGASERHSRQAESNPGDRERDTGPPPAQCLIVMTKSH